MLFRSGNIANGQGGYVLHASILLANLVSRDSSANGQDAAEPRREEPAKATESRCLEGYRQEYRAEKGCQKPPKIQVLR